MNALEKVSLKVTNWIGTPQSIVVHTLMFAGIFGLKFLGVGAEEILLILTTAVSLEAIYLAIFIQMTVNRNTESLEAVEDDIEDIQEDVKGLEEDVEEIQEDTDEQKNQQTLSKIESGLQKLLEDVETLKKIRANQ